MKLEYPREARLLPIWTDRCLDIDYAISEAKKHAKMQEKYKAATSSELMIIKHNLFVIFAMIIKKATLPA